jgi:hypothetical protein
MRVVFEVSNSALSRLESTTISSTVSDLLKELQIGFEFRLVILKAISICKLLSA